MTLEPGRDVILGLTVQGTEAQFYYGYRDIGTDCLRCGSCAAPDGGSAGDKVIRTSMLKAGPCVNISFLSDEACREGWFTGTMVGICCQDLTGFGKYGDFDWFEVRNGEACVTVK